MRTYYRYTYKIGTDEILIEKIEDYLNDDTELNRIHNAVRYDGMFMYSDNCSSETTEHFCKQIVEVLVARTEALYAAYERARYEFSKFDEVWKRLHEKAMKS